MNYVLPNINDTSVDSQGNTLEFKGRVKYNATYDNVGLTFTNMSVPEIYRIAEDNFTINPFFDASGNPISFDTTIEFFDYESARVFFRAVNSDGTINYILYKEPQTAEVWNKLVDTYVSGLKIIDLDGSARIDLDGTYRIEASGDTGLIDVTTLIDETILID